MQPQPVLKLQAEALGEGGHILGCLGAVGCATATSVGYLHGGRAGVGAQGLRLGGGLIGGLGQLCRRLCGIGGLVAFGGLTGVLVRLAECFLDGWRRWRLSGCRCRRGGGGDHGLGGVLQVLGRLLQVLGRALLGLAGLLRRLLQALGGRGCAGGWGRLCRGGLALTGDLLHLPGGLIGRLGGLCHLPCGLPGRGTRLRAGKHLISLGVDHIGGLGEVVDLALE